MITCALSLFTSLVGICFLPTFCAADQPSPSWPAKLFTPYAYIPYEDSATRCLRETGQKYYTLAFVISDPTGQPAWDGQKDQRVQNNFYARSIQTIRAAGGDVIGSFGGEGGKELALTSPDAASLAAKYGQVIDRYHLTWLDLDIEGHALADRSANARRNAALHQLQTTHPGLRVTFTLASNPTGLEKESLALLTDARDQHVVVESVNVMTMDYSDEFKAGAAMGALSISAAQAAHQQLLTLGLTDTKLGITPMIGRNDVKSVIFSPEDARLLLDFARQTPWVRSVSFWSVNRDQAQPHGDEDDCGIPQPRWAFTNLFKPLTN